MFRFFNPDQSSSIYTELKNEFLMHVTDAYYIALYTYNNKYDQERHASTGYIPVVEANKNKLKLVYKEIKDYVAAIENNFSDPIERSHTLLNYAQSIATAEYKNHILFMSILAGKLNKHWLPASKKFMDVAESISPKNAPKNTL